MNSHKVQTTFRRRAAALTVLYPRHDGYWREIWDRTLEDLSSPIAGEAAAIPTDWLDHFPARERADDGRTRRNQQHNRYGSIAMRQDEFPYHRTRKQIVDAISRASSLGEDLWRKMRELIHVHWDYASKSGDSYFAVRTTHNLCNRLLRLEPSESYLAEIQVWTLQAIEAEPDNAYMWDLWAKVLSALGMDEAFLSVRWESIRRFPDNCVLRSSLSEALSGTSSRCDCRESTSGNYAGLPGRRSVSEHFLAELLIRTEREGEAENLLRETIGTFPRDVVSRHIFVKLLWNQGRREETAFRVYDA